MKKLPTANEFLNQEYYHIVLDSKDTWVNVGDIERAMVEFAKVHVETALKEASDKVVLEYGDYISDGHYERVIDKDSILNSYSLDNIK